MLGDGVPPSDIANVTANPAFKPYVYSTPEVGTTYLFLNAQMKPFDNVKVRQAVEWAVNRDKIVKLPGGQAAP